MGDLRECYTEYHRIERNVEDRDVNENEGFNLLHLFNAYLPYAVWLGLFVFRISIVSSL